MVLKREFCWKTDELWILVNFLKRLRCKYSPEGPFLSWKCKCQWFEFTRGPIHCLFSLLLSGEYVLTATLAKPASLFSFPPFLNAKKGDSGYPLDKFCHAKFIKWSRAPNHSPASVKINSQSASRFVLNFIQMFCTESILPANFVTYSRAPNHSPASVKINS